MNLKTLTEQAFQASSLLLVTKYKRTHGRSVHFGMSERPVVAKSRLISFLRLRVLTSLGPNIASHSIIIELWRASVRMKICLHVQIQIRRLKAPGARRKILNHRH